MLQDPNPSQLLRTRIEASLRRAIELRHPEAAMLLGTLYGLGKLSDDGLPEPEKSASLYIKVIEEFKVPSAKRLLLEVMERHDITVPGYDLATLRGETRLH
jgi:TPR repeat protein